MAHVLSSFGMGGQERVALNLAAAQVRAGWRVTALSLAPPPDGPLAEEFRAAGAERVRLPRWWGGVDPLLVVRLARRLRQDGVALAHTHNPMSLVYGAPAAALAGIPVVHTKHGNSPAGGRALALARLCARWTEAFVAVSPETAAFARERREVDTGKLSVIPNGIALDRFRPDPAARARVRRELGIGGDAWVVGTVGRFVVEKNHPLLVRAAAPLLGSRSRLVFAGDGPLKSEVAELAARLGVAPFVHFLGARGDVPDVLNALDVFALSSSTEGLPLVVPEAMASALPVVSTAVGGLPTVLDEGRTGFLVAPGDEETFRARLAALRTDGDLGRALGARGRTEALERFSSERMHREYLGLYERVLAGHSRRGRAGA